MQAGHSQGYELTTTALAVSILDRFAAKQYLQVDISICWLLQGSMDTLGNLKPNVKHWLGYTKEQTPCKPSKQRTQHSTLQTLSDLPSMYLLHTAPSHNVRTDGASKQNELRRLPKCSCNQLDASLNQGNVAYSDAHHASTLHMWLPSTCKPKNGWYN